MKDEMGEARQGVLNAFEVMLDNKGNESIRLQYVAALKYYYTFTGEVWDD